MDLKPILIVDVELAKSTVGQLMQESHLGMDCEGVDLGVHGQVTLIQIVNSNSEIFLFDVLVCPEIAPILKPLLENPSIVKVGNTQFTNFHNSQV